MIPATSRSSLSMATALDCAEDFAPSDSDIVRVLAINKHLVEMRATSKADKLEMKELTVKAEVEELKVTAAEAAKAALAATLADAELAAAKAAKAALADAECVAALMDKRLMDLKMAKELVHRRVLGEMLATANVEEWKVVNAKPTEAMLEAAYVAVGAEAQVVVAKVLSMTETETRATVHAMMTKQQAYDALQAANAALAVAPEELEAAAVKAAKAARVAEAALAVVCVQDIVVVKEWGVVALAKEAEATQKRVAAAVAARAAMRAARAAVRAARAAQAKAVPAAVVLVDPP